MGKTSAPMEKDVLKTMPIKPAGQKVKKTGMKGESKPTGKESEVPLGARRVWNEVRPMVKKPTSVISRFNDKGPNTVNTDLKPHLAPGVPKGVKKGYYSPGRKPKKSRGGDSATTTYPPGAHAGAGYS